MKILAYTYINTYDNSRNTEFFPVHSLQDKLEITDAILNDFDNDNERILISIDMLDIAQAKNIYTIDRQTAELAVKMYEAKVPVRLLKDYIENYSASMDTKKFVEQWVPCGNCSTR